MILLLLIAQPDSTHIYELSLSSSLSFLLSPSEYEYYNKQT